VAGLLTGLPKAYAGGAYTSDAPEVADVRLGFVAVLSCAPIVVAHEKGFFKKHGLESTLVKESSWATVRDKLVSGENHATHMKLAQPIAATMGLMGSPKTPVISPFTLSRNGSVFMVAAQLKGKLTFDPKTWKTLADELKAKGETLTIALPFPFGWHGLMVRHFLANAGINADKELKLITLPPAQMVQNLRVGTMHACAMVEPWGTRGVSEKVTTIAMYGHEMWPNHPTKTLGVMEKFADQNPRTVRAMLRALHEAAAWCDDFSNRPEIAKMLAVPSYLNSPEASLLPSLMGEFDWGDGRKQADRPHAISFAKATAPEPREVKWFISQFRRWGMTLGEPDYDALAKKVTRPELYRAALKDLGVDPPAPSDAPIKLWDGTSFDPQKAAAFAKSSSINNLKG
jgi:nitrate/nitrite transport system substrate-binding protein